MEGAGRRPFLISKGWIQVVVLVILAGFFVLGLLAYRTYQAKPPIPQRTVDEQGRVLFTAGDVQKGQQVFLHNGLMEYGSAFGHGAYLGPDFTADYLRRSSIIVTRAYGGPASDSAAQRTIEDFRANRYDEAQRDAHAEPAARSGVRTLVGYYSRFFSDPDTDHGLRPNAITDPRAATPADGVLRLDRVGRVDGTARAQLFLHEQLAARAAGRQQADGERRRLVGAVADRAAERHRAAVRRVRALGWPPGLARPRTGDAQLPRPRRRRADARAAGDGVVLLRHGGAVSHPDVRRRGVAALPRGARLLLRPQPRDGGFRTTSCGHGTSSSRSSGSRRRSWRPASSWRR